MKARKAIIIGLCICATFSFTGCNDKERLAFGNKFYGYMSSKDYTSIQENSTLNGYEFVSTADVKALVESSEFAKYAEKSLTFAKAEYDKDTGLTTLTTEDKKTSVNFKFIDGPNGGYMWDNPKFYTDSYTVYAPLGSTISVNGKALTDEQYVEDDGVTATYEIDRLPNLDIPVVITNPYFDTINKTLNPSSDKDSPSVAVSEKTVEEILTSMDEQFNAMYSAITPKATIESFVEATGRTFAEWDEDTMQAFLDTAKNNRKFKDPFIKYTDAKCTIRQVKDTEAVFVGENTVEMQLEIKSSWKIGDGKTGKMDTVVTIRTKIDNEGWLITEMSDWSWLQDLNSIRGES